MKLLFPERSEGLHAMLLNFGHETTSDHSYSWNGLKRGNREFAVWQYTISGEGCFRIGKKKYELTANKACFLIVPEDHCYYLPKHSKNWEYIYITIYGSEAIRLSGEFRRQHGAYLEYDSNSKTVNFVKEIIKMHDNGLLDSRYKASMIAYNFLMTIFDDTAIAEANIKNDFINKVYSYCQRNVKSKISIEQLAEYMNYSQWHFCRKFQTLIGKTPNEFVNEYKMRLAVRFLQSTQLSLKEIADECGFDNVSYFCRVFKKYYRISPGSFRNGAN